MSELSPSSGALLREIARLYTRAQRSVADECQSTSTQCHVLTELWRGGPLTQSELGARLVLEKSWVSRAIDAMVTSGSVTKTINASDGRSRLITLTARGRRVASQLNQSLDGHADQLLSSLSARQRTDMDKSLLVLVNALRDDEAQQSTEQIGEAE